MSQNMGWMVNALYQPIQHKLYTLKNTMINEVIAIIGINEGNSDWSKITINRIYIIGRTYGLKQG